MATDAASQLRTSRPPESAVYEQRQAKANAEADEEGEPSQRIAMVSLKAKMPTR